MTTINKGAPQWKRYRNLFGNVENPGAILRRRLGLRCPDPIEFILKGGIKVRVPIIRLVEFKEIVMDDAYLRGFRPGAIGQGRDGQMAIIDVGANLGFFSLYIKAVFPQAKVIGIEPLPGNYRFMQQNLDLNPQLGESVVGVNAALAAARGSLRLRSRRGGEFPTDATLWTEGDKGTTFEVPALALADLLSQYEVSRVSLLKLDCEGAEYDILYRAKPEVLERVEAITMEVHKGRADNENIQALGRFLCRQGFACGLSCRNDFLWAARDPSWLIQKDLLG